MHRRLRSALLALVVLPLSTGPALAIGTLDQEVLPGGGAAASFGAMSQTFTVGMTGDLDTISLYGNAWSSGPVWNVSITAVSAGAPTGPNLATGSAPAPGSPDWTDIALTPALPVTAGLQLAIVVQEVTPFWYVGNAPYGGGSGNVVADFAFRTFVTPRPIPTTEFAHLVITSRVSTTTDGAGTESVSIAASSTVYRTITIANGGTNPLAGLTVTDSGLGGVLPASCPALPSSLPVGGSYTCKFSEIAKAGTTTYTTTAAAGGETATGHVVVIGTSAAMIPTIGSKHGLPSAPGVYTGSTKVSALNRYVTWQADFGAARAGERVGVQVATKSADGSWGPFAGLTSRLADASGIVRFSWRQSEAAWSSVRFILDSGPRTPAAQARWR